MLSVNGQRIEVTNFPDQTSQVWNLAPKIFEAYAFDISWEFKSESEFFHLAQLKALLDLYKKRSTLEIHYLPYARQDKDVANNATFALRPFANLLNSLKFDEIQIHDPHSLVATECIHNAQAIYPVDKVNQIVKLTRAEAICYPDKGARTKYSRIYQHASLYGEKLRDQQTGRITSYEVFGDPKNKNILIVDDICDGGATFILLSRELLSKGASDVNLFVTHGIFSKGLDEIRQAGIKRIFTRSGEAFQTENQIFYKDITNE